MSVRPLRLAAAVVDEMLGHARSAEPNEACGLLSGTAGVATAYHPARNAAASAYRFDVHPEDLVRIVTGIEAAGSELVAVFHSHPHSDPVPSATDRREARYRVPHLIATLRVTSASSGAALRAWSMEPSAPVEVPLLIG